MIVILMCVDLRYIRNAGMNLSQPALGKLMGIDGQSIAHWEKSGKVQPWPTSWCACSTMDTPKAMSPFAA